MSTPTDSQLTQRTPDGWDSVRFSELVLNFGSFRFQSLFPPSRRKRESFDEMQSMKRHDPIDFETRDGSHVAIKEMDESYIFAGDMRLNPATGEG